MFCQLWGNWKFSGTGQDIRKIIMKFKVSRIFKKWQGSQSKRCKLWIHLCSRGIILWWVRRGGQRTLWLKLRKLLIKWGIHPSNKIKTWCVGQQFRVHAPNTKICCKWCAILITDQIRISRHQNRQKWLCSVTQRSFSHHRIKAWNSRRLNWTTQDVCSEKNLKDPTKQVNSHFGPLNSHWIRCQASRCSSGKMTQITVAKFWVSWFRQPFRIKNWAQSRFY